MRRLNDLEYQLEENVCDLFSEAMRYFNEKDYSHAVRLLATCRVFYNYLDNPEMFQLIDRFIAVIPIESEEKDLWRKSGHRGGEFLLNLALHGREFIGDKIRELK